MDIEYIDIDKLVLDASNPRFAELYTGSTSEKDLIEYLLFTESAEEIAKAISITKQFYPDKALWVLRTGETYLVKDGNRRCAAAKALQHPVKYGLDLSVLELPKLPVLVYADELELDRRIREEHTASLFKEWDRIAKALEVYRMHKTGSSVDALKEMDTDPSSLIKLASFYYAAVKVGGDDLKKLLRRGRKTGGKTIIFERLFKYKELCGFKFKNKPSYEIEVVDYFSFTSFVSAIVAYLKDNSGTTHSDVDKQGKAFLKNLDAYGFVPATVDKAEKPSDPQPPAVEPPEVPLQQQGSTKIKPVLERKQLPPVLKRLIEECYGLDAVNFPNAKLALTRVVFECVLKYVLEETSYMNSVRFVSSPYFNEVFFDRSGQKRPFTDFTKLKTKFSELVVNTGKRKAFQSFDLERPHQIIHNYNVGGVPADAVTMSENLMPLVEFLLQDEVELLKSLDLTKL
jgi:hypothetical protein